MRFKKIYIEITNSCNLNCSFCSKSSRGKKSMSLDEFKYIINEIKGYTNYVYFHVKGEPLMHNLLGDFIDICNDNNINVNITTNSLLLNKYSEELINKKVRQINFSLHSYIFDEPISYLNTIIEYAKKAKKNGCYSVFRFWAFDGKYSKNEEIFIDYLSRIFDVSVREKLEKNDSFKIDDCIYVSKSNTFIWPDINNSYYNIDGTCYALRDHIGILSDGTIIPCCLDGEGIIDLGNIYKNKISDVINSKRVIDMQCGFRNNKKVEEICRHCKFLDV